MVNYINNLVVLGETNPTGLGGFHNMLLHSGKPLILYANSYILCLARDQHVLITAIEHYPLQHTLIHVRAGESSTLAFYLLGCDV